MNYQALGQRIREQRNHLSLTQEELAFQAGISVSFLGHIERGTRKASMETMLNLANALQCDMNVLFCDSLAFDLQDLDASGWLAEDGVRQKLALALIRTVSAFR